VTGHRRLARFSQNSGDVLNLDLTPQAPLRFAFEPPGYQLHVWREDEGLATHTAVLGEWAGHYPFHAASQGRPRRLAGVYTPAYSSEMFLLV
jgi:hypothetical protein